MNIIKLSAINSTNDYLKQMSADITMQNFTVVTTESQTSGRGQMGAIWVAEPGKNLTFSILLKDVLLKTDDIFTLNICVAVSIAHVLSSHSIPGVKIKWPNDILAENKKIGGILIENSFKSNGAIQSIIGIGLNVNQGNFEGMATAGSLFTVTGRTFSREVLLTEILQGIKNNTDAMIQDPDELWSSYHSLLFKKNIPMPFEKNNQKFMGIIKGVSRNGRLQLILEDDITYEYGIKEIKMLY